MEHFFAPTPDQSTDILAPMNPAVRNDWLTPTVGIGSTRGGNAFGSTRTQPAFGMLNAAPVLHSGIQAALAVLSFVSAMLRG